MMVVMVMAMILLRYQWDRAMGSDGRQKLHVLQVSSFMSDCM